MPLSSAFSLGNCSSLPAAALALGFPHTEETAEPGNVVPVSCVFDPNVHFAVCAGMVSLVSKRAAAVVPVSVTVRDVLIVAITLSIGQVEDSSAASIDCNNSCCVS